MSQSIAWLPCKGKYKFSYNVLFADGATRDSQKERAEILLDAHREINILLMKKKNLSKAQEKDLQELESLVNNYDAFNNNAFIANEIEYGISQNQSFGLKANLSSEKNLQYKYTNKSEKSWFKENIIREVGCYYKHSLYKNDRWQISLMPQFTYNKNNIFGQKHSYMIGSYIGYTKISKSGKRYFSEIGFNVGKIFNRGYKDTILKKISVVEGVELVKNLMVTNYFEYSFATNGHPMYRAVVYEQISLAKEFVNKTNHPIFTTQIGYYWKRNLSNSVFQLSGPVFSVCLSL